MTPPMNGPTTPIVAPSPLADSASEVAKKLSGGAKRVMVSPRFVEKGWEPGDPFGRCAIEMVDAGLFTRADGRCGFEAFKDSFIVPTELGLAVRAHLLASQVPGPISNERGDE